MLGFACGSPQPTPLFVRHSCAGRNPVAVSLDGREKPNRRCRENPRFSPLDSCLRRNDEQRASTHLLWRVTANIKARTSGCAIGEPQRCEAREGDDVGVRRAHPNLRRSWRAPGPSSACRHLLPEGEKSSKNGRSGHLQAPHKLPPLPSGERVGVRGRPERNAENHDNFVTPQRRPGKLQPTPTPSSAGNTSAPCPDSRNRPYRTSAAAHCGSGPRTASRMTGSNATAHGCRR